MWPGGDRSRERVLSVGAIDFLAEANADRPDLGVRKGERVYRVRLFKDVDFGGPTAASAEELRTAPVWKQTRVRGHMPGPRGVWDLLGGALKVILGHRLEPYVIPTSEPPACG